MHIKKITTTITFVLFCSLPSLSQAQLTEEKATPSVISEPDAILLITEVNFKNTQADWIKIRYKSPSNKAINIKGLSLADDNKFKTIEEDFIIASEQEVLLTFKSEEPDNMPYLYTSRSGLTGTTEQIIIYDQSGEVVDAVCWTSSKPTESEKEELQELFDLEGWNSPDITSCIPSDDIEKEESIKRNGLIDTNSKEDWTHPSKTEELTAPPLQEVQEPVITASPPQKIITPPKIIEVEEPITTPKPTKSTSTKKSSSSKTYKNGNLSSNIIISELLPNPDGSDTKKEWIELYNKGETNINLGNWKLDDSEDGSKPYTIPDTINIKAGETILIESKNSKLALGNKEDSIRLFNFKEELVDEIQYEEAPSDQSYSLIKIIKEDESTKNTWIWSAEKSPNSKNPEFQEFTAEITSEPKFEEAYSFEVTDKKDQIKTIIFNEELIAGPLAKATLTVGSTILLTVEHAEETTYILKKYEIIAQGIGGNSLPSFIIPSIIGTIILICGATFFFLNKKLPWQETKA